MFVNSSVLWKVCHYLDKNIKDIKSALDGADGNGGQASEPKWDNSS